MKKDNQDRSAVTDVYVQPGDVFIEYDSVKDKLIRYAQRFSSAVKYSNFVHAGIATGVGGDWLIHSNGKDKSGVGQLSQERVGDLLDHKQYHIFRPNDQVFAEKIANVAYDMYNRVEPQNEVSAKLSFKGSLPPKTSDELRYEFHRYVDKDSDAIIFCTKFVVFVIQYAAIELGVNYVDLLNIRHTGAIPSRLIEVLKHNMKFEEFRSEALVRHGGIANGNQNQ